MSKFEREDAFWKQIEVLSKLEGPQGRAIVPAKRYEELYQLIDELYSTYEAGNFVKLVASLKSGTYCALGKGLIDLKSQGWDVERLFKGRDYRTSFYEHYKGGYWEPKELVKLWQYKAQGMEPERKEFIGLYKALLLREQREVLFSPSAKVA